MLYASTAGMATKRPTAVATSASEMPVITVEAPAAAAGCAARSANARMMPSTVPKRPMNGALFPSVPRTKSHFSYSSLRRAWRMPAAADRSPGLPGVERADRLRQAERGELHREPLLDGGLLALEQRALGVGHFHLRGGARLELRADQALVLARIEERLLRLRPQRARRLEVQPRAPQ